MDILSKEERSKIMGRIKSSNTSPELLVRKIVYRNGFRYRLFRKDLPGKPDLAFISKHKVIFVNGCFWHGHSCLRGKLPKSNVQYWSIKIQNNKKRDKRQKTQLTRMGWKYLVIWECELKNESKLEKKIMLFLSD